MRASVRFHLARRCTFAFSQRGPRYSTLGFAIAPNRERGSRSATSLFRHCVPLMSIHAHFVTDAVHSKLRTLSLPSLPSLVFFSCCRMRGNRPARVCWFCDFFFFFLTPFRRMMHTMVFRGNCTGKFLFAVKVLFR